MSLEAWPGAQPIKIWSVAHNMIDLGEQLRNLRRGPTIGSRPKTDHEKPRTIQIIREEVLLLAGESI